MMNLLEKFNELLEPVKQWSPTLVNVMLVFGAFVILIYLIIFIYEFIQCLRLYLFSRICQDEKHFEKKYGKWVVISGSTEGIGLEMAKKFAKRGMSIILMCYSAEKLANARAILKTEVKEVGEIITIQADLADSSVENFEKVKSQIDPDNRDIGVLINNVGTYPIIGKCYHEEDMAFIRHMVNLNILSTLHMTRMILPGMLSRDRGLIVNVSSLAGSIAYPLNITYAATKHFITDFSRQLQHEYSHRSNIDVINLSPTFICTKHCDEIRIFSGPSIFYPLPGNFAESAVNAFTTGIKQMTGTFTGEVLYGMTLIGNRLDLSHLVARLFARMQKYNMRIDARQTKPDNSTVISMV